MVGYPIRSRSTTTRYRKISVMPLLRWVASWSLHRRGGPTGFQRSNIDGGVPDSIEVDDNPLPENFGDATTSLGCIVVAAQEGGRPRFSGKQHKWGGTRVDRG